MMKLLRLLTSGKGTTDYKPTNVVELNGFTAKCVSRFSTNVVLCAPKGESITVRGEKGTVFVNYLISPEQRTQLDGQGDYFINLLIAEAYKLAGKDKLTRVLIKKPADQSAA